MNLNFTWDKNKATANRIKHKISFEEAGTVFKTDPELLTIFDEEHSDEEDRWITIGVSNKRKLLIIVHTFDETNSNNTVIRIISARKATRNENKQYKKGI
jgi:uncharacterized protein